MVMRLFGMRVGLLLLVGVLSEVRGLVPVTHTKCKDTFCPDLSLTIQITGINNFLQSPSITTHYLCVGFDEDDTVAEGRLAADYILERYGLDYTGLPAENYIDGTITTPDPGNNADFFPTVVDTEDQLRLILVTTPYGFDSPDIPVRAAFWCAIITVGTGYTSTGTFVGVIPVGALVCYGSYIVDLCRHPHFCYSFLRPRNPRKPLFIRVWTLDFLLSRGPAPDTFVTFNFGAELDADGREGLARGIFYRRPNRPSDGIAPSDGHLFIKFPGLAPLENEFDVRDDRFTCKPKKG